MPHTYATVDEFSLFMTDGGDASWTGTNVATVRLVLEAASRRVDGWASRSRFGSGFGPRIGTNLYNGDGSDLLELRDDLLSVGSVVILDKTGGTGTTETGYYLEPNGRPQKRYAKLTGLGTYGVWTQGLQTVQFAACTWGYSNDTLALGSAILASSSATTATLTSGSAAVGMTILAGTEHLYVTAATGGTALTVLRAQNGTTATTGTVSASYYVYPPDARLGTLLLAQRRWRGRESGLTNQYGGGDVPVTAHLDSEYAILRANVGHLRLYSAG